jgi:hypothetical protein
MAKAKQIMEIAAKHAEAKADAEGRHKKKWI